MQRFFDFTGVQLLVCFVGLVEAIIFGYSYPYYSLLLEERGASNTIIGINAMLGTVGAIIVGPIVPKLIIRYGYRSFSAAALAVAASTFLAVLLLDSTAFLFVYRLFLGFALASLWISTEAWLNHVVDDRDRGYKNAFFQTCYAAGFFLGPMIAANTQGSTGPTIALFSATVGLLACVLFRKNTKATEDEFEPEVKWSAAWSARNILFVAFLVGVAETAIYTLLPVYGLEIGFAHRAAVMLLVLYTLGEAVLTLPIGWLADQIDRRTVLACSALIGAMSISLLMFTGAMGYSAWVTAFVAGGTIVGLYNIALVILGETYSGSELPVVSASFTMAYAIGCSLGSTFGGVAMDVFGPNGLPIGVSALLVLFAIAVLLLRIGQTAARRSA